MFPSQRAVPLPLETGKAEPLQQISSTTRAGWGSTLDAGGRSQRAVPHPAGRGEDEPAVGAVEQRRWPA